MPVHFDEKHLKPKLRGGESELEWFSRKDETHRTTCAPLIFSRWVEEVRIWKAKLDTGHLTLIHVQAVGGGLPRVFVSPHPEPASQTSADKTACAQARAYIVEMVGAPPPCGVRHRRMTTSAGTTGLGIPLLLWPMVSSMFSSIF